jgi:hypothetical protein
MFSKETSPLAISPKFLLWLFSNLAKDINYKCLKRNCTRKFDVGRVNKYVKMSMQLGSSDNIVNIILAG